MKLLFVISSLNTGGAQRAVSNIVCNLPEDVEVDLLLNTDSNISYPYKGRIIALNVDAVDRMSLWYQLRVAIKRYVKLKGLKRDGCYDAVISFLDSANFLNIVTGRGKNKVKSEFDMDDYVDNGQESGANRYKSNKRTKIICSIRAQITADVSWKYKYIVVPLAKLLYPYADWIVPNSLGNAVDMIENLGMPREKVVAITNGFDLDEIRGKAIANDGAGGVVDSGVGSDIDAGWDSLATEKGFKFLNIGRLHIQKCQWGLIRAFCKVADACENARLMIIGDGEEREFLEKLVADMKLEDKVQILPFQSNPYPYYKAADVFVMPSLWEGYPNVLCEAMICGTPVIATDFPSGARELLAPDTMGVGNSEYASVNGDSHVEDVNGINTADKNAVEFAKYGLITPVLDRKRRGSSEPLTAEEEVLADAMIQMYQNKDLYDRYTLAAKKCAEGLAIESKVHEWLELCK